LRVKIWDFRGIWKIPSQKFRSRSSARYDGKILPEDIPDDVEEIPEWNSVSGQEDIVSGRVLRDRYDKVLRPSFFLMKFD
jgi:hypothetical protein